MPQITLYHFEGCPACRNTKQWIEQLRSEKPELKDVDILMVDVHKTPGFKAPAPFQYVPTFFVDDRKVLEGDVSKDKIEYLMRAARQAS